LHQTNIVLIKSVRGYNPTFGKDCYFAENSTIIGDVIIGNQVSVWFQAVIRGDVNSIRIGNKVNIQDGVIIHGTYKKASTNIGDNVSIIESKPISKLKKWRVISNTGEKS